MQSAPSSEGWDSRHVLQSSPGIRSYGPTFRKARETVFALCGVATAPIWCPRSDSCIRLCPSYDSSSRGCVFPWTANAAFPSLLQAGGFQPRHSTDPEPELCRLPRRSSPEKWCLLHLSRRGAGHRQIWPAHHRSRQPRCFRIDCADNLQRPGGSHALPCAAASARAGFTAAPVD